MKDNQQEYGYQGRREQDWENRRISRQSNYGQENPGSYGNAGFSDESYNPGWRNRYNSAGQRQNYNDEFEQRRNIHYLPDNDDNRYMNQSSHNRDEWQNRNRRQWNDTSDNRDAWDQQRNQDWGQRGSYNYNDQGVNYGYGQRNDEGRYYGNQWNDSGRQQINRDRREYDRNAWDKGRDEVSSWFGDDAAERRRDMDRNETGLYRGKGPKGYQRSKERIHEDICDRLTYDDRLDASEIDVSIEDNEVILSGTVTTREEKRRAEDIAESIPGVRNVQNKIKIAAPDVGTTETMNTVIRKTGNMPDQGAERL